MSSSKIEEALKAARELLATNKISKAPVPLEKIIRSMGYNVQFAPLDGELSGMAFIKDGTPTIGVNSLHHPNRQRFTMAHELGHITLHRPLIENAIHLDRGSLKRDVVSSLGVDPIEIQANTFAAELLMPSMLLERILSGRLIDLEDDKAISDLAKIFRVSQAAMRFRFEASWK